MERCAPLPNDDLVPLGILLALISAALLSLSTLLQGRGVRQIEAAHNAETTKSGFAALIRNKVWLAGALLLGVATVVQMGSLAFAPLMVVQPLGVAALVFTSLFSAKATGTKPSKSVVRAIITSVIGVAVFVTVASLVSTQKSITDTQLYEILGTLLVVLVIVAAALFIWPGRTKMAPVVWVLLGGLFSGFVAALGKTVITRVQHILTVGHVEWDAENFLTICCILGIGVAGGLSMYFVQLSHTVNKAEVVVAGLTVVDPAVAVVLGIVILNEASGAPWWSMIVFIGAGALAVRGVMELSKAEEAPQDVNA